MLLLFLMCNLLTLHSTAPLRLCKGRLIIFLDDDDEDDDDEE